METTNRQITDAAINQTEANNQAFCDAFYNYSIKWMADNFKPFTSDDIKADFLKENDPPINHNAFGAVFFKLSKKGLIIYTGRTKQSVSRQAHCRHLRIWISADYSALQSQNRRYKQPELNFNQSA